MSAATPTPKITLYGLPISHPVRAAREMLDYKDLTYKRIDLINGLHAGMLRALGFPHGTAPAMKIDGRKVQGTLAISRELDRVRPEPPLFPSDTAQRAAVVEAERWGERELQPIARMIAISAFGRDASTLPEFMADAALPVQLPPRVVVAMSKPLALIQRHRHSAGDEASRAAIARLPAALDHVEQLLDAGVIGGEQPNAADFQIATSVRVLLVFDDLRPLIDQRRAAQYARSLVPDYAGHIPAVLPDGWLEPLRLSIPA
jgi:glutathione S-transferase